MTSREELERLIRDNLKVVTVSEDQREFLVGYCMGISNIQGRSDVDKIKARNTKLRDGVKMISRNGCYHCSGIAKQLLAEDNKEELR